MSSAKPSLSPAAATEQPPPTFFRFSLLTLLSVMTLAGFTSAIVFSRNWYVDERLLLAFWCAGLILGMSIGRFRSAYVIISGSLGAVVGCVLATVILFNDTLQLMPELDNEEVTSYAAFVVSVGWVAAILATAFYRAAAIGMIERMWFSRQSRRVGLALGGSALGFLIAWQLVRERPWLPTWEIDIERSGIPNFELSPRGDFLYVSYSTLTRQGKESPDHVFQLTNREVVARKLKVSTADREIAFSPDGAHMASGDFLTCQLMDLKTGDVLRTWPLNARERMVQLQFDDSGEHLLMTTITPKIQRLYVIEIDKPELPPPKLFPFAGFLYIDPAGETLIKVFDAKDETDERRVEVVRLQDEMLLGEIRDLPPWGMRPVFSTSGEYLAFENRVWARSGGKPFVFTDQVVGLPTDKRVIVLNHELEQESKAVPNWLRTMPFVRHSLMNDDRCELHLVDIETGKVLVKTPTYQRMLEAELSDDGNVIVSAAQVGRIRIWKVPEPAGATK